VLVSLKRDVGLLSLRLVAGGLLAGHGAQKLFGLFEGPGLEGTRGAMEGLGMRPSEKWALAAGLGEFGSGVLTALGFLNPAGPLGIFGPMMVATRTAHANKPIWVTAGGAELPVMYMAVGGALALTGPGRFSLDHLFGVRLPAPLVALMAAAVAGGTAMALLGREVQSEQVPQGQDESDHAEAASSSTAGAQPQH
jgi:putative oxidoreductase